MRRIPKKAALPLLAGLLCAGVLLPVGQASANKVGNPGSFTATIVSGSSIKVGSQEFNLSDPVNLNGSVTAAGNVTIPESGADFPTMAVGDYDVHINVADPITGTINPLTGAISLNLRVWIKIDGVPFGGGCRIGSDSSPIVVNPLTTGSNGAVTGTPYNPSSGTARVVNGTFSVPASSDCGPGGGVVNDTVGIPSGSGNNNAQFNLQFSPILTKGVNATFTATPSSGTIPLTVNFNAGGSTCSSPCSYRWDFDNNGTTDTTTSGPTTSHTYSTAATYTARLTTVDAQGDSDTTTRTITANPHPPDLTINKQHTGNFLATTNGVYTLTVANGGVGATAGTTTVTDTLPTGISYVSATGTGWSCSAAAQVVTCTRTGLINPSTSAPAITLTTAVAGNAPAAVTNTASVSTPTEQVTNNNSDSDPTTIDRVDAGIVKSHEGNFQTGAVETWDLDVTNHGTVATTGATTVTDTLPGGISYAGFDAPEGWGCSAAGQAVTCTRPAGLGAGESETVELHVTAGVVAVGNIVNTASVSTPNDSSSANNSDSDPTTVDATVDLTIDKSHTGDFRVGSPGAYTISVQNRGARPTAGPTTVTDTLPAGLTPTAASGTGWACGVDGQEVTCEHAASLGAGESAGLITLNVTTGIDAMPGVTNSASVATGGTGDDADVNPGNDFDDDATTVNATDLTIDKSHVGGFPLGGQGTYTLSVRNDGGASSAGTTTVTDTLPAELTFVSAAGAGWSCGAVGQDVTCTRAASIGAGQTAPPIALVVDVANTEAEETVNSATVSGADDIDPSDDSDTDPTPLTAADLSISKTHSGDFRVDTTRAYVVRVENIGSQPTSGATTVTDTLPAGLTYVAGTGSGWSCDAEGQQVSCERTAAIASGAQAPAITIQAAVGTAAYPSVTNEATVANQEDRNDANDTASDPTTITAPDLSLTKAHLGSLQVNDRVSYVIEVDNEGTAATNGAATVTDELPTGLSYAGKAPSSDAWSCGAAGQLVTCEHDGDIAAGGGAQTLEILADVEPGAGDEIENTATVAVAGDPNPANDSGPDTAGVGRIDLSIDKSHTGDLPRGGVGAFTIEVSNEGSDPTQGNTRVTDSLPVGLGYESATGSGWSCSVSAGTVRCDHAGSIAAGADAAPITLNVDVAPGAGSQVTNTASVSTPDDAENANDSDSDQADVAAGTDAAISLRPQLSDGGSFRVGTNGAYTVTVRNSGAGTVAGPVTATVELPAGLSFVSGQGSGWSCSAAGQDVTCTRAGGLAAEERSDIEIEVGVAREAVPSVTATAEVSAPGDTVASNDTAASPPADVTMVNLAIAMTHAGSFAVGAQSTFTINVENVGSAATIAATKVTDTFPAGLAPGTASGAGWNCTTAGQAVSCVRPASLAVGDQAPPITIPVTPSAGIGGLTVSNTALVATKDDAEQANNSATDTATIGAAPGGVKGATAKCKKAKKKKGKKRKPKCKKKKKKK